MAEPCKNVNGSGRFLRQQLNKPIGLLRIILMAKDRWEEISSNMSRNATTLHFVTFPLKFGMITKQNMRSS